MNCPFCGSDTRLVSVDGNAKSEVYLRNHCPNCGRSFQTVEHSKRSRDDGGAGGSAPPLRMSDILHKEDRIPCGKCGIRLASSFIITSDTYLKVCVVCKIASYEKA